MIGGDDGGLWISWDGGNRWWKTGNLPVSQFYHVSVDDKDPYQVYGGLQDNGCLAGPRPRRAASATRSGRTYCGGDGFFDARRPHRPRRDLRRDPGRPHRRASNRRTGAARDIQPKAGYGEKLRFNWNTPIHASPTQKGTLYIGAQFLFRSRDRGTAWERISPDLTSNDPEKQKQEESGGITVDNSAAEMHTTIYSISESPKDAQVLWVGTDDGNLQLTRDGGQTWTNVVRNVPGLPPASWVSWVEASRFDAGHGLRRLRPPQLRRPDALGLSHDRFRPDAGRGSRRRSKGVRGYAHVSRRTWSTRRCSSSAPSSGCGSRSTPAAAWAEFKGGDFPSVAVRDLQVHPREHDLVIATHGRGIWIVDDITPLRALSADVLAKRGGVPAGPSGPAEDARAGRLGRGRRRFRRTESRRAGP